MVEAPLGEISTQLWKSLQCDEKQYLVKYHFDQHATSYDILFYKEDDASMWRDTSDTTMFRTRWKEYNPNIESNSSTSLAHLQQSLDKYWRLSEDGQGLGGGDGPSIKVVVENDVVNLVVKSKLKAGIPFSWRFVCVKCEKSEVKDLLVDPLFGMVKELTQQRTQLFSIIEKKDREIEDYKDQGVVPSRKNLATVPFSTNSFLTRSSSDQEFSRNCFCGSKETFALPDVQQLYKSVMRCRKTKQSSNESRASINVKTLPASETIQIDTVDSIGQESIPRLSETKVEESVSEQAASIADTDTAETEMDRREKIRRRLEEEEERKKKKKKKLKI